VKCGHDCDSWLGIGLVKKNLTDNKEETYFSQTKEVCPGAKGAQSLGTQAASSSWSAVLRVCLSTYDCQMLAAL
jgi:hypothetical protein